MICAKPRRAASGFSYVEVLVTLALTSAVVALGMWLYTDGLDRKDRLDRRLTHFSEAQFFMSQLRDMDLSSSLRDATWRADKIEFTTRSGARFGKQAYGVRAQYIVQDTEVLYQESRGQYEYEAVFLTNIRRPAFSFYVGERGWQPAWELEETLPVLVRLSYQTLNGEARHIVGSYQDFPVFWPGEEETP